MSGWRIFLLALAAMAAGQEPAPQVAVVRAGQLIDGSGGPPLRPGMVLIRGHRVEAVGRQIAIPPGAQIIDLGAATLLPGLIDLHTHLTGEVGIHWEEIGRAHV